jgi:hypothetical protein
MRKIIIHLGLPKTGTTSLQFGLFKKLDNFKYLCRPYIHMDIEKIFNSIIMDSNIKFESNIEKYQSIVEEYSDTKDIMISNEALMNASLYPEGISSKVIFERLKSIFNELGDLKFILVLRDQVTIIPSYFAQFEKNISFEDYINKGIKDNYSIFSNLYYDRLLNELYEIYDEENILCLRFEDFKENKELFAEKLSSFLLLNFESTLNRLNIHKNKKSSEKGTHIRKYSFYDFLLAFKSKIIKKELNLKRFKLTKYLVKYLNNVNINTNEVHINKEQKKRIIEKYKIDSENILKKSI